MKVLNVELNFDFADADDLERFEKEYPETEKRLQEIKWDNAKASETIRSFCKVIFEFFDKLFGEGTAEKVFKGTWKIILLIEQKEISYEHID